MDGWIRSNVIGGCRKLYMICQKHAKKFKKLIIKMLQSFHSFNLYKYGHPLFDYGQWNFPSVFRNIS